MDDIVQHTYWVHTNFKNGKDVSQKDKLNYIEVGKGVLVGFPKMIS